MSQNDFTIANQTFPNTRADINSALQALASTSSGSSDPSTTFANQLFYDTSNNLLKIRNEDNDAFITICELDQTNDTVEYFKSDSVRTALIEFTDGDDALTIADGGALTTAGNLSIGGSNNELRFYEGSNFVGFEAPALTGDQIFVLPAADGTANQALVTDGSGTLSFASSGESLRPNVKPLIINGAMQVAQRSTSLSGQTGSGYQMDRFGFLMTNFGTWTMSQETDAPTGSGFVKSLKWNCTTADTSLGASDLGLLHYRIEGQDVQLLKKGTSSAEKVTVSFWVKSAKTGTYIVEVIDADNTRFVSKSYTISSANTWEKKVLSFPADTTGALGNDTGNSLAIQWWLGAGSTYASGTLGETWNTTNANRAVGQVNLADSTSNNWYLTGVQLEVGEFTSSTIPKFQHEMYDDTLLRCHRYFITGAAVANGLNPTAEAASATTVQPTPQLRRTMRVAPTLTANAVGFIATIGGSGNTTTLAFSNMGQNGFRYGLNIDSSITTQQNVAMGGLGADMDAEL